MKRTIETNLMAMGYRLMEEDMWGKPFGYHLMVYYSKENELINYIKSTNGNSTVWGKTIFSDLTDETEEKKAERFIEFLKDFESNTDVKGHKSKEKFDFLNDKQLIKIIKDKNDISKRDTIQHS